MWYSVSAVKLSNDLIPKELVILSTNQSRVRHVVASVKCSHIHPLVPFFPQWIYTSRALKTVFILGRSPEGAATVCVKQLMCKINPNMYVRVSPQDYLQQRVREEFWAAITRDHNSPIFIRDCHIVGAVGEMFQHCGDCCLGNECRGEKMWINKVNVL